MIPWPIAVLVALYTIAGTAMGLQAWRAFERGAMDRVGGPLVWCVVFLVMTVGLARLRPWSRHLTIWVSVLLMAGLLTGAVLVLLRTPPMSGVALWATLQAGLQVVIIRYMTRPRVKTWFLQGVRE